MPDKKTSKKTLDDQTKTIGGIEEAVKFLSKQYDEILKRLTTTEKTTAEVTEIVHELRVDIRNKDREIKQIRTALNDAEQYSR